MGSWRAYWLVIVGAIPGVIAIALAFCSLISFEQATAIVLLFTFVAILWYSVETQQLKEISTKRPCVSLYRSQRRHQLEIKNYGDGVARGVTINGPGASPLFFVALLGPGHAIPVPQKLDSTVTIEYSDLSGIAHYHTLVASDDPFVVSDYGHREK